VGTAGGGSVYAHGDFSGPIGSQGRLAYRLNILDQGGETSVNGLDVTRRFASGTVDFHIMDNLLLEINALTGYYEAESCTPNWFFSGVTRIPSAPDNSYAWAPSNSYNSVESNRIRGTLNYGISDVFTFRTAYLYSDNLRKLLGSVDYITGPETYYMRFQGYGFSYIDQGGYAYLDAKFNTLGISHTLTMGVNHTDEIQNEWNATTKLPANVTNLSLSDPDSASNFYFPAIRIMDYGTASTRLYLDKWTGNNNYLIGDSIKFNDKWSALAGVNDAAVDVVNVTNSGSRTGYNTSAFTPTGSLLFKPMPWMTLYATYIESLEQGVVVAQTYKNAGEVLPPLRDRQYEIGSKAEIGKMLLTLAVFQIDKANQYSDDGTVYGTYVQNGREVHNGVEFTASGKATEDLTLFGGATYLDATVKKTNTPSLEGKEPVDVAKLSAKAYAEYNLPFFRELTLTGGVYYTGPSYADALNTLQLPGYATGDVGARYTTQVFGKETIYRLSVTNVLNKNYWLDSRQLGSPRTIMLNGTVKF